MELWVNGQMRMRWIVENTDEYAPYTWKGYWDGTSTINVVFVNHDSSPDVADLVVDFIKVNNVTVQTESTNAVFCAGDDFETPSGGVPATETVSQTGVVCYTVTGTTPLARLFEYDYNNMVTSINENGTVSTYTYNPAGQRVKKVEDGTATYYFYANYQVERTASTETQVVYYYINGEQIAQRTITETSEQLLYVHKDHLGSAVRLTDESGNVVQSIAYEPYGTTVYSHGNNEPDRQFTGQIKDGTGLYYYNARYYNPTLGRFITADTVLDGLNRYTYCGNNPVRYTDPTGHGSRDTKNDRPSDSSDSDPSPYYHDKMQGRIQHVADGIQNAGPELPADARNTRAPYEDGRDRDQGSGDSGNSGRRDGCVLVDNRGNGDSARRMEEDFNNVLIRDARNLNNIDEMIRQLDKNGVYQILAGMHSIVFVVYNNRKGEKCFLATELTGSGKELEPSKLSGALTGGFPGSQYELNLYMGLFNEEDLKGFYERLHDDPTEVTIFSPKATDERFDMHLVAGKMIERWMVWDTVRPNYHAHNELLGINSNTYANDILRYAVGQENWIHIPGFPGAWGQDFEVHRPR